MKTYYIGFSRNKQDKIGSRLIRQYLGKVYSHTFFEFNTKRIFNDTTIFHSSMSNGVSYWSNWKFEKQNTKTHLYEINIDDNMYKKLRIKLHKRSGDKYAFAQNIGILLVDFLQKNLKINIKNPFRDGENCSELVFLALVEMHPELINEYKLNTISPKNIENILKKYKYKNVLGE